VFVVTIKLRDISIYAEAYDKKCTVGQVVSNLHWWTYKHSINKQSPLSNDHNYFEVTFFERIWRWPIDCCLTPQYSSYIRDKNEYANNESCIQKYDLSADVLIYTYIFKYNSLVKTGLKWVPRVCRMQHSLHAKEHTQVDRW
jgi:hypothetical protein